MGTKLSNFKQDTKRAVEGVWTPTPFGDIEFLLARLNNPEFRKMQAKLTKPYLRQVRARTLPEETQDRITLECVCHTVLLDWKNVEDDKGKAVAYKPEIAQELFSQEDYRDVYEFVILTANDGEVYRFEMEADAKEG